MPGRCRSPCPAPRQWQCRPPPPRRPPSTGAVYWDDMDLAGADEYSVHSRIAVIAQAPARWPMTAGHNILVGRLDRADPDRAFWRAALEKSGTDEVLAGLPDGEHT